MCEVKEASRASNQKLKPGGEGPKLLVNLYLNETFQAAVTFCGQLFWWHCLPQFELSAGSSRPFTSSDQEVRRLIFIRPGKIVMITTMIVMIMIMIVVILDRDENNVDDDANLLCNGLM